MTSDRNNRFSYTKQEDDSDLELSEHQNSSQVIGSRNNQPLRQP